MLNAVEKGFAASGDTDIAFLEGIYERDIASLCTDYELLLRGQN
jgi:hypothetical protein